MSGKYDPDRIRSSKLAEHNRKLPPIKRFMTDEEWWESDNYKRIRDKTLETHARLKKEGIEFN